MKTLNTNTMIKKGRVQQLVDLSQTVASLKHRSEDLSLHPINQDKAMRDYIQSKQRLDALLAKAVANGDIPSPPPQRGVRSISDGSHGGSHMIGCIEIYAIIPTAKRAKVFLGALCLQYVCKRVFSICSNFCFFENFCFFNLLITMYDLTMDYFRQIAQIPRCSKKEEKIRARLLDRATSKGYTTRQDEIQNIVIVVPATPGREDEPVLILQSHMDMVCVADPESAHNFDTDPISLITEGEWLSADGTTLGADNGIGLAMSLAAADTVSHPPLELLITVDEEQGLTGALQLDGNILEGKLLINLDTEDEGEICISSAGGGRVDIQIPITRSPRSSDRLPLHQVSLIGMQGGHSGVDIHKHRGNAIIELLKIVDQYFGDAEIVQIDGGVADNAIPAHCSCILSLDDFSLFSGYAKTKITALREQFGLSSIDIQITACDDETLDTLTNSEVIENHRVPLQVITSVPSGVISMSESIDGLVQTSQNIGMLATHPDHIAITYAPRSSVMSELDKVIQDITTAYEQIGSTVIVRAKYPGRQQNPNDALVTYTASCYEHILGKAPEIVAYHAGLECGAIVEKLGPDAQAVSFGPTILDPHSPHERCHLPSVRKCCDTLELMLAGNIEL